MRAGHIGLSVVATDVGGGFSIGLGGLGFIMGISGSWMLFTGLLGAWLSAVFLIPRIYPISKEHNLLTFPQSLAFHYNKHVAFIAGIISLLGYIGFTSSQILAGAKLATATLPNISIDDAVLLMGLFAVGYTVIGGIKAVVYTDTIQWLILMAGLLFIGIPVSYHHIGGWASIRAELPDQFLNLASISPVLIINWIITIVPIWFIGMTLYQRIYACKDRRTAIKAWRIAGFFEWPIMAFMGVILGLFARVAFSKGIFADFGYVGASIDPELGLPLMLRSILPIGLMGLVMSAYFSAIMSTADSCLMAASGNLVTDVLGYFKRKYRESGVRLAQIATLLIGSLAILLAIEMHDVLELMLYSYSFMVSGLLVPVLAMLILKRPKPAAALVAMISGGFTTLLLIVLQPGLPFGLDENFFGILISLIAFITLQRIYIRPNGRTDHSQRQD